MEARMLWPDLWKGLQPREKKNIFVSWAISHFDHWEKSPKWNFRLNWESPAIKSAWLQTSEGFSEMKTVILCKSLYPLYSHCDPAAEAITAGVTWSWQCQTRHCCSLWPARRPINLQPAGPLCNFWLCGCGGWILGGVCWANTLYYCSGAFLK